MSAPGLPPTEARATDAQAVLRVDLGALVANWRRLAARAAPAECAAVVKADAYGLGIEAVVPPLARAGCRTFFVAHAAEGVRARAALRAHGFPDTLRIFLLHGFHPDLYPAEATIATALSPVIGSLAELARFTAARAGRPEGARCGCAIHIDTGINRLGFDPAEAGALTAEILASAGAGLVMSHLVSAEAAEDPFNTRQMATFAATLGGVLGRLPASLANSSGIFLGARAHHALVRPGYALYGGNPTPGRPNPMLPVLSLEASVLQVRAVPAGASAGYNARWTAQRASRLAVIGVGYADGLPIAASGIGRDGAVAEHDGVLYPLVGRISMDLSLVDVTDAPPGRITSGTILRLLGPLVDVDDLGRRAGTIGYEILTRLGRRYRRDYIAAGADPSPAP